MKRDPVEPMDISQMKSVTISDYYHKDGSHYQKIENGPLEYVGSWVGKFALLQIPQKWPWDA